LGRSDGISMGKSEGKEQAPVAAEGSLSVGDQAIPPEVAGLAISPYLYIYREGERERERVYIYKYKHLLHLGAKSSKTKGNRAKSRISLLAVRRNG
jgi:hypothetical protein